MEAKTQSVTVMVKIMSKRQISPNPPYQSTGIVFFVFVAYCLSLVSLVTAIYVDIT